MLNCSPEMGTDLSAINEEPSMSYYILLLKFSHRLFTPTPACVRDWVGPIIQADDDMLVFIAPVPQPTLLAAFCSVEIISILFKSANPESAHISIKLFFIG